MIPTWKILALVSVAGCGGSAFELATTPTDAGDNSPDTGADILRPEADASPGQDSPMIGHEGGHEAAGDPPPRDASDLPEAGDPPPEAGDEIAPPFESGAPETAPPIEAGQPEADPAEAGQPEAAPPLEASAGDGCTAVEPSGEMIVSGAPVFAPTTYPIYLPSPAGWTDELTPASCQCAETWTCACLQNADVCGAFSSHWEGCVLTQTSNGSRTYQVPTVTCD